MWAPSHATNYAFILCWHVHRTSLSPSLLFPLHALQLFPMSVHYTSTSKLKWICGYMKISPICVHTCRLHKSLQTSLIGSLPEPVYVGIVMQPPTATHVQPFFSTCTPLSSRPSFHICMEHPSHVFSPFLVVPPSDPFKWRDSGLECWAVSRAESSWEHHRGVSLLLHFQKSFLFFFFQETGLQYFLLFIYLYVCIYEKKRDSGSLVAACWATSTDQYPCSILGESCADCQRTFGFTACFCHPGFYAVVPVLRHVREGDKNSKY